MYQPESRLNRQITFADWGQAYGMPLDSKNIWVILADKIPWKEMEHEYVAMFPSKTGRPAIPFRMALGALIIQKRKGLSDRALVRELNENPYLQYFIGLETFTAEVPMKPTVLVNIRKRLDTSYITRANDIFLANCGPSDEHAEGKESEAAKDANEEREDGTDNLGTAILDATCSPSNIKYPQDFVLLNKARELLDEMIDYFNSAYGPWKKPRTYRRVAREAFLAMAKTKKRSAKKMRRLIRKQLGCVLRNIGYVEEYMAAGYAPLRKHIDKYLTILELYRQQKYMFDNRTHSVGNRIVSIDQPYIRPVVRGKARTPVEFGAKYDVSIDGDGHARLEKVSFDPYNESGVLIGAIERYRERNGHYPSRVLVDKIYRTRDNLRFCSENGIEVSGPGLGRPPKEPRTERMRQNERDRIEVERFFSKAKRCYGAALIMTKLAETTMSSIALSVLVANMFTLCSGNFFVSFWIGDGNDENGHEIIIMEGESA